MSIMHASSTISNATNALSGFNPTNSGRISSSGFLVVMHGYEFNLGSPGITVTGQSAIWVTKTASDCVITCAGDVNGDTQTEQWYNTSGTPQGAPGAYPGTGTDIFTLNDVPDSVNIYTVSETNTDGTCSFIDIGTWTDDDKSTFTNLTQDVNYGKYVEAQDASGPPPATGERGNFVIQFTFRKSGYDDYTITFSGEARARSEWEP